MPIENRAFDFLHHNDRPDKPRETGITEMRGPYYDPMGPRELKDILETMGWYIDIYKFSGGSFALMPEDAVTELIDICHEHDVKVSTGGFIENVLVRDHDKVEEYIEEAENLGFDIVEISSGFIATGTDDMVRLTELVQQYDIDPNPRSTSNSVRAAPPIRRTWSAKRPADPEQAIEEAEAAPRSRAEILMVEAEGITEEVTEWRTDVAFQIANELGIENLVFEALPPNVRVVHQELRPERQPVRRQLPGRRTRMHALRPVGQVRQLGTYRHVRHRLKPRSTYKGE